MCYSVVSLFSQSATVPTINSPGVDSYGSSPTTTGTSGYGSYGSPSSDFEPCVEDDMKPPYFDELPPPLYHQEGTMTDNPPKMFGYPQPSNGLLLDYDPMYSTLPYNGGVDAMFGGGTGTEQMYSKAFGAIAGSNFCFSNYPQMAEERSGQTSPANHSLQHSICKVCGDTASGNHFGVLSCEACKSFFRRSIRANARYACRGNRQCAIEKHTRNRCQYCRLQKCAAMGMRKEAVQEERTPSGAKLQRAGTPTPLGISGLNFLPPTIPYLPRFDSPTSPVPRVLSQASRMYGSLPNLKMEFDRPSTSPYGSGTLHPLGSPFAQTGLGSPQAAAVGGHLSVSVLVNADMQSEGQAEEVKSTDASIKLEDLFEGIRTSLMKVIEWAKRIPAFVSLSLDDQVKLLKASWCEQCTLRLAARNGPKSDSILLGHGLSCKRDQIEDPEVRRVLTRVFNEIAYWLDYMNVDRVELACLKGIILFNPDAKGLSPASRKKVEIYQEQILAAMESRTKTMYPITPQRFSKLLLRLAPVKAISLEVMQHMEVQRALGNAKMDNLFGELLDFD